MNFIYAENDIDLIVEPIRLNGKDGAVHVTDSDDDLDLTFEDLDVALAWAKRLTKKLKKMSA